MNNSGPQIINVSGHVATENQMNEQWEESKNIYTEDQNLDLNESEIFTSTLKIAMLNKMLPKGFRFELTEVVQKQMEQLKKKTSGLANYQVKKPEIQNEVKQQKIFQKYM